MKIAIQERMLPGDSLSANLDNAEQLGVEGVELWGDADLYTRVAEIETALQGRSVCISSVCGQAHFDWLDPDPEKRAVSLEETRRILEFCGHFGAAGQIVPPIFGPPRLPDLSPLHTAVELERQLLTEIVREMAPYAAARDTLLLLEPLNRYEQHLLRRQQDGIDIIQMAGNPAGVALLSDFFHMHIEETDTPQAFREAGQYVGHVHVADNTRQEPGTGDIDWCAGLQALKDIGFSGYLTFESAVSGDDPMQSLQVSVNFLREALASL
jgi:sugar phosphate isomerase/epimerase